MHTTLPRPPSIRRTICGLVGLACLAGCEAAPRSDGEDTPPVAAVTPAAGYKSSVDEGLGVSVAILLDNSGSMGHRVPGDVQPKSEVAKAAIERMLWATEAALAKHPDYPVKVGLILFSTTAHTVLAMQPYDRDSVRAALARLPSPSGGTAIGDAMQVARAALYGRSAGTFRKVMLVVTDGENNAGATPVDVAHEIHSRSEGGVGMYFVAFDTDPGKFGFLRDVKGDVIVAQNGDALQASLAELYENKVLAESPTEPDLPTRAADSSGGSGNTRAIPRRATLRPGPQ